MKMGSIKPVETKIPKPFNKALHFTKQEFLDRQKRALDLMKREGLDGFLLTKQESLYYLTGYDTFGYGESGGSGKPKTARLVLTMR